MKTASPSKTAAVSTGLAVIATLAAVANGQNTNTACLSLKGSSECPSFQNAYINPRNLSTPWPWFTLVTDVSSFDQQFAQYFTDPNRFIATKFINQLQCNQTAVYNTTLQWERTILCGQFTQISWSAQCNVENDANPIMVCQDTCLQYQSSENDAVANPAICLPGSELTAAAVTTRNNTLAHDYTSCTEWTSLVSKNNATCVEGVTNEGNCGYGPGVSTQLCTACDPTGNVTISSCCYDEKTNLSSCASYGHPGAAAVRQGTAAVRATASASPGFVSVTSSAGGSGATGGTSAGSNASNGVGSTGLTGGQLAGIIVGSIIGALLIGALLAWLLFGFCRKRNNKDPEASRGLVYGGPGRSSSGEKPWNQSETGTTRSLGEKKQSSASGDHAKLAAVGAGAARAGAIGAAALGSSSHNTSPQTRPDSQLSSGTGGSDGRGTTVAQVRDQYTGQDIFPGEEVIAIYPYNASLNDELTLEPDQKVTIVRLYDDGWALGRIKDGQEGAIPLVCVSSTKGEIPGRGGNGTGTGTSDDEGLTSGAEYTSSVDGAVTAEEGGFTSDATGYRSDRSRQR